ncbi:retrotransposon protein [Hordeum vulgare]|nr:retrotransposon protein [Hordeum vulgare]
MGDTAGPDGDNVEALPPHPVSRGPSPGGAVASLDTGLGPRMPDSRVACGTRSLRRTWTLPTVTLSCVPARAAGDDERRRGCVGGEGDERDALHGRAWVRDITGGLSVQAIVQYLRTWDMVESVTLREEEEDTICWKMSKVRLFVVSSAYQMFFMAKVQFPCHRAIWKSKATPRCKFFMWLAVHLKCLTADNLRRPGWPCDPLCSLCHVESEDCDHLFILCRFSCEVWGRLRAWSAVDFPIPGSAFGSTEEWWLRAREKVHKNARRNFDTVVILVHWKLWKERNARIFYNKISSAAQVLQSI